MAAILIPFPNTSSYVTELAVNRYEPPSGPSRHDPKADPREESAGTGGGPRMHPAGIGARADAPSRHAIDGGTLPHP